MNIPINELFDTDIVSKNVALDAQKCDLWQHFKVISGFPTTSSSDSDIYLLKLKSSNNTVRKIFMKTYILGDPHDPPNMERLNYETISKLYSEKHTRNILPALITAGSCSFRTLRELMIQSFAKNGTDAEKKEIILQLIRNISLIGTKFRPAIEKPLTKTERSKLTIDVFKTITSQTYGYILTFQVINDSPQRSFVHNYKPVISNFYTYLKAVNAGLSSSRKISQRSKDDVISQFKQYMFQLIFTLAVFESVKFKHNDLHLGNILIDNYYPAESKKMVYKWKHENTKNRAITYTTYIPRIFDFDRATSHKHPNINLDYASYGQSSTFTKKTDLLKLVCGVYSTLSNQDLKKWIIDRVGNNKDRLEKYINSNDDCFFQNKSRTDSGLNDEKLLSKLLMSPIEIITNMKPDMLSNNDSIKENDLRKYRILRYNSVKL